MACLLLVSLSPTPVPLFFLTKWTNEVRLVFYFSLLSVSTVSLTWECLHLESTMTIKTLIHLYGSRNRTVWERGHQIQECACPGSKMCTCNMHLLAHKHIHLCPHTCAHTCTHMHIHTHTHHTCNTHTTPPPYTHTLCSGRKADWKLPSKKVHWAEYELVWCSRRPYQGCWNCQQRSPLDNPGSAQLSKEILKMIHLFHDDVISHFISSKELSPYLRS